MEFINAIVNLCVGINITTTFDLQVIEALQKEQLKCKQYYATCLLKNSSSFGGNISRDLVKCMAERPLK